MADVFISYADEDRERARLLAEALQGLGFGVSWDRQLTGEKDYADIVRRQLHDARAVVMVLSNASVRSRTVRDEASYARDEGRLLPVLFDRVPIPLGFGHYEAEDLTRWKGSPKAPELRRFEATLRAKLDGHDVNRSAIARKRRGLMARVRIAALLAVMALIAALALGPGYLPH